MNCSSSLCQSTLTQPPSLKASASSLSRRSSLAVPGPLIMQLQPMDTTQEASSSERTDSLTRGAIRRWLEMGWLSSPQNNSSMTTQLNDQGPQAHRLASLPLPPDFLDVLRADGDNLFDVDHLDWVLQNEVELPLTNGLLPPAQAAPNVLGGNSGVPLYTAPPPPPMAAPLMPGWSASMDPMATVALGAKIEPSNSGDSHDVTQLQTPGMFPLQQAVPGAQNGHAEVHQQPHARNSFTRRSSHSGSLEGHENDDDTPAPKKKRTRNAEQMAQNRVAQQKYRERKKQEHEQLQSALEQLTAQLAAMKALEAKTAVLSSENAVLSTTVAHQNQRIAELTQKVESQAAELASVKQEAAQAASLVSSQQMMILDQHNKLKLQEEVIEALRGRLKDKMDMAFEGHDPKTVCQRMVAAVRAALAGAKNVEGLQEVLEQLPDDVVTDICKSILCEVKSMWPELAARLHSLKMCTGPRCGEQVCAS